MSETKLKPCPFCGGEAKYISFTQGLFIQRFVTCTKCGIETPRNCLNRKDAIKRWNNRTPMANIVEKLEELADNSNDHMYESYFDGKEDGIREAINIVKQEINKEN